MAECPKCKEEIEHLVCYFETQYLFKLVNGEPEYDLQYDLEQQNGTYFCPECNKRLFNCVEKATKFLK